MVATHTLQHTVSLTLPWDETFDVGSDTGTPTFAQKLAGTLPQPP